MEFSNQVYDDMDAKSYTKFFQEKNIPTWMKITFVVLIFLTILSTCLSIAALQMVSQQDQKKFDVGISSKYQKEIDDLRNNFTTEQKEYKKVINSTINQDTIRANNQQKSFLQYLRSLNMSLLMLKTRMNSTFKFLAQDYKGNISMMNKHVEKLKVHFKNYKFAFNKTIESLNVQVADVEDVVGTINKTIQLPNRMDPVLKELQLSATNFGWFFPLNGFQYALTNTSQTWQASKLACNALNATLAVDGIMNYNLRKRIAVNLAVRDFTWIGLSRNSSLWKWVDGSNATSQDIKWHPNEPNESGNEECADIFGPNNEYPYTTNDDGCWRTLPALCEKKV